MTSYVVKSTLGVLNGGDIADSDRNLLIKIHDHDNLRDHHHDVGDIRDIGNGGDGGEDEHPWERFLDDEDDDTHDTPPPEPLVMVPASEPPLAPSLPPLSQRIDALETTRVLPARWNYYYHLPNDKNWNLASYKLIVNDIDTLEKLIAVNENVTDNIIKNCMLFMMREGVTPMWEDTSNRNGGCFSYKVSNKVVVAVWRELAYRLCGYSLTVERPHMDLVNGITISPKRGFCIVKVWLRNCSIQDPHAIVDIENLVRAGCLFKTHKAEF